MQKYRGPGPTTGRRGLLTLERLRVEASDGTIDTVVLAFTDMQGRLQGKRLSAEFFLDEVAEHYSEGCNYLLAVDVDMNTVDGYAMSSWERGYGDFVLVPDMATLRRVPWHEGTVMVTADLTWLDGAPVVASPRQILKAQTDRLAERGLVERCADPADGRGVRLSLTEAGRSRQRQVGRKHARGVARAMTVGLNPGELGQLEAICLKLAATNGDPHS